MMVITGNSPPDAEVAQLLVYMPIIMRADTISDWDRQFCISMVGRSNRGPLIPSRKQVAVMRRIVTDFKAATRG